MNRPTDPSLTSEFVAETRRPLRILIDAREVRRELNGLGRYTTNLLEGLAQEDAFNQYVVLAYRPEKLAHLSAHANFSVLPTTVHIGDPREHFLLPYLMWREQADIFHTPSMVAPLLRAPGCATMMTLHDTIPLVCPEGFSRTLALLWALYFMFFVRPNAWLCTHIVTVSEHSRRDLAHHVRLPLGKISVIHNWLKTAYQPVSDPTWREAIAQRFALPSTFVLYVGSTQPYKNLIRLFQAYARALPELPAGCQLLLSGRGYRKLHQQIVALGMQDHIRFLGYVPEADLPALYSMAALFVYPSLYEGFGLPPLEAMACGTPVLVADTSSLPEVVGNAGMRVDPTDVGAIALGISQLLNEPQRALALAQAGRKQAGRFTAQRAVHQTLALYESLAAQTTRGARRAGYLRRPARP